MCARLRSGRLVEQAMLTRPLGCTSSTADPMAQAMGLPPKVLKCHKRLPKDLAISRGRRERWVTSDLGLSIIVHHGIWITFTFTF